MHKTEEKESIWSTQKIIIIIKLVLYCTFEIEWKHLRMVRTSKDFSMICDYFIVLVSFVLNNFPIHSVGKNRFFVFSFLTFHYQDIEFNWWLPTIYRRRNVQINKSSERKKTLFYQMSSGVSNIILSEHVNSAVNTIRTLKIHHTSNFSHRFKILFSILHVLVSMHSIAQFFL